VTTLRIASLSSSSSFIFLLSSSSFIFHLSSSSFIFHLSFVFLLSFVFFHLSFIFLLPFFLSLLSSLFPRRIALPWTSPCLPRRCLGVWIRVWWPSGSLDFRCSLICSSSARWLLGSRRSLSSSALRMLLEVHSEVWTCLIACEIRTFFVEENKKRCPCCRIV